MRQYVGNMDIQQNYFFNAASTALSLLSDVWAATCQTHNSLKSDWASKSHLQCETARKQKLMNLQVFSAGAASDHFITYPQHQSAIASLSMKRPNAVLSVSKCCVRLYVTM